MDARQRRSGNDGTELVEREAEVIDLERDPAPPLPAQIVLPREDILSTLREVQEISFRRALWGKPFRARFSEAVDRFRSR